MDYPTAACAAPRSGAGPGRLNSYQVSVFVEESQKTNRYTLAAYEWAVRHPDWRRFRHHFTGPPSFRPKEGLPQLQAADVLAYELTLQLRRMFVAGEPQQPVRKSYLELVRHAHEQAMRTVGFPLVGYDPDGTAPNAPDAPSG